MSRIVSVWLPRWPIRRFLAAQAREAPSHPVDASLPFVLAADASGGARIAALNAAAAREGLAVGDRLADARAKTDFLQTRDADPKADDAALRKLAFWATRYSPAVAPFGEQDGADGLFIDVTGVAHLFGGERTLMTDLTRRLAQFGFPARAAAADTAGAAWAMARLTDISVVRSGDEATALGGLSLAALRLPHAMRLALRRLGFVRVEQLIDAPRAPFATRFDHDLLKRLDQALGRAAEPLAFIEAPPLYHARRPLLEPIFAQADVVAVAADLMRDLIPHLTRDGVGARRLRLSLYRVDGDVASLDIGAAQPTRDPAHVAKLIDLRLDRLGASLDAQFGFEALGLAAHAVEAVAPRQTAFTDSRDERAREQGLALIDRLRQRLGPAQVRRLAPVASHLPARAEALRPADEDAARWAPADASRWRPPLLLPQPEEAAVMTLVPHEAPRRFRWRGRNHAIARRQGPERIAGEWWRQTQPTRDYYIVEDDRGRRFWLYREGVPGRETETPRWFVHGLFA